MGKTKISLFLINVCSLEVFFNAFNSVLAKTWINSWLIYVTICFRISTPFLKGHAVAQLVEALRYKPEGHGFDSRWCHWNFSLA